MKNNHQRWNFFAAAFAVLCLSSGVGAQSGDTPPKKVLVQPNVNIFEKGVTYSTSIYGDPDVTAAPYSATIVEESVQTLADGNTITHKSTSRVYRDSQGRVRREESSMFIGPMTVSAPTGGATTVTAGPHEMLRILINDPVSGTHYSLDPESKIATEMSGLSPVRTGSSGDNPLLNGGTIHIDVFPPTPEGTTSESLGAQTMEGLTVIGTRTTRTIPAGQIGNTLPILVTTEEWFSQDLQITVLSKHSDPRTGTTTMQLTDLSRAEPDASLFVVPPGYKIKSVVPGKVSFIYDVPQPPQNQ